jgi:hypothetical protein
MYGKFFESTFTGSMFGAGAHVFALWGYVIANTSRLGDVELNPKMLAPMIGCGEDEIRKAIEFLCAPDCSSRSKVEEGRRIVREGEYLYRVINHGTYRAIKNEDDRREYKRRKQAEYRAKNKPQKEAHGAATNSNPAPGSDSVAEEQEKIELAEDPPVEMGERLSVAWARWVEYRAERKLAPYKPRGESAAIKRLMEWGEERAVKAIEFSMAQNYQGVFEEKESGNGHSRGEEAQAPARLPENLRPGYTREAV